MKDQELEKKIRNAIISNSNDLDEYLIIEEDKEGNIRITFNTSKHRDQNDATLLTSKSRFKKFKENSLNFPEMDKFNCLISQEKAQELTKGK